MSDPNAFPSICSALACVQPFDVIKVRPGIYNERLQIMLPVEIIGCGPVGSAVLCAEDEPAVEVLGSIVVRIAGLRVGQTSTHDSSISAAVIAKSGATLVLEDCSVTSSANHCIVVQGTSTMGYILHSSILQGKGVGILVCDGAKAEIRDNEITSNGRAGVAILSGADPLLRENKIHSGYDSGVLISENGRGRIEANDIFANKRAGIAILKGGAPLVRKNRIYDGFDSGVLVCEGGRGCVVDNDIFANQMAGVAIGRNGASSITGNTIRDGQGGSLCLSQHSKGKISSNLIVHDPRSTMQVPKELLNSVQKNNQIKHVEPSDSDMDVNMSENCTNPMLCTSFEAAA